MTIAIALLIEFIAYVEISPIFLINRRVSTPRNCNRSAAETFVNPFELFGKIFTSQTLLAK